LTNHPNSCCVFQFFRQLDGSDSSDRRIFPLVIPDVYLYLAEVPIVTGGANKDTIRHDGDISLSEWHFDAILPRKTVLYATVRDPEDRIFHSA
jgi:hypothetical protein